MAPSSLSSFLRLRYLTKMFRLGLKRKIGTWLVTVTMVTWPFASYADDKENALKAALIYKMGKYVTWTNPPQTLHYCFVGEESQKVGVILEQKVKQLQGGNTRILFKPKLSEIERYECQIIYMANSSNSDKEKVTDLSKFSLTIGANTKAMSYGFISVLELKSRKPLLYTSRSNLKNARFKLSSRLLKSSKLVD